MTGSVVRLRLGKSRGFVQFGAGKTFGGLDPSARTVGSDIFGSVERTVAGGCGGGHGDGG